MRKAIHPEAQIIWGLALDDAYGDEVRVTVIAAGFDAKSKKTEMPAPVVAHDEQPAQPAAQSIRPSEGTQVPPLVQSHTPDFAPGDGDVASQSLDDAGSDDTSDGMFSANDPGDLDIPDFLR